ncbi:MULTISPECIES: hypothetical protein [Anaerofustis]|uniref:hypothetical protein n=1 Tax=Anaerofustis TaxID=264995 RepID=UPI001105D6A8|nr:MULTISPECIES: hypothetical protein [Anaerofustis]
MKKERKKELDNLWNKTRIWLLMEDCSLEKEKELFSGIEEYKGTGLEIPVNAESYEMEKVAEILGKALNSKDECYEYLESFNEKFMDAIYKTSFDSMIFKYFN